MVKCPHCGFEGIDRAFTLLKTWKYGYYNVKRLQCPICSGKFNYYHGVSPRGKTIEFVIRVGGKRTGK